MTLEYFIHFIYHARYYEPKEYSWQNLHKEQDSKHDITYVLVLIRFISCEILLEVLWLEALGYDSHTIPVAWPYLDKDRAAV